MVDSKGVHKVGVSAAMMVDHSAEETVVRWVYATAEMKAEKLDTKLDGVMELRMVARRAVGWAAYLVDDLVAYLVGKTVVTMVARPALQTAQKKVVSSVVDSVALRAV